MRHSYSDQPNPELDLVFERVIDVPQERVWAAWTMPNQLMTWFCPLPWKTVDCEIDLRRRYFSYSHAFTGRARVSESGLLSRSHSK